MAPKPTAKSRLKQFIADAGWKLDVNAKKHDSNSWGINRDKVVQDENIWLKPAAHGGTWRIELRWNRSGDGWHVTEGDQIKEVHVFWLPEGFTPDINSRGFDHSEYKHHRVTHLERVNTNWKHSDLWDILWDGSTSLRKMVERLVTDTDLAAWLAKEHEWKKDVERRAKDAAERAEANAAAQPLEFVALGGDEHGWNAPFTRIAGRLVSNAQALAKADGTTDVPKLIADAQRHLEALIAALDPEGAQRLLNYRDQAWEDNPLPEVHNTIIVELDA